MYLVDVTRPANDAGVFSLYGIGDMHSDRKEFMEKRFKKYRDVIIKDPTAVAIFVGDAMEGRTPGMKHFDPEALRPEFQLNIDSYVKMALDFNTRLLKPIADAGVPLVILEGNHDRMQNFVGFSAMLADRCGAKFLGGEGFVRVRSGKPGKYWTTTVYATHGSGGGKRPGGKINNMQQNLEWVDADVLLAGHVHDGAIRVIHSLGVPSKGDLKLVETPRVLYRVPSFVARSIKGHVNYAGRQGYPMGDDGLQWPTINPAERLVRRQELLAPRE